jgi:RimJ/RimL family protein N-acetyltransferase
MGRMIILRAALPTDAQVLFEWRNDAAARSASSSRVEVEWEGHQEWLARVIADPRRFLYVAESTESSGLARVGTSRFDLDPDGLAAEVSINLNPEFRGRGLAAGVLEASLERFSSDWAGTVPVRALIRPENSRSVRLFTAAGFVRSGSAGDADSYLLA